MTSETSSLSDVLASLRLERVNAAFFVGDQLAAPDNHILGGHLGAQALMAASHTAAGRSPHSVHTYFLRPGDAQPTRRLRSGRTAGGPDVLGAPGHRPPGRHGAARGDVVVQGGQGRNPSDPDVEYQPPMPAVPEPEKLPYVPPHFAESEAVTKGQWSSLRWFERRIVDAARIPPARSRIWWRPDGDVPDDPMLLACLVAYLSAVTLTEPAFAARPALGASAQRDHSVWFHGPADLSDWLLYDQSSPSSADCLALAAGTMFNRNGDLVCTVKQEMYFPPSRV